MKTKDKITSDQNAQASAAHTSGTKALQKKAVGVVQKVEPEEEVQQHQSEGTVQKMDAPELDEEHPEGVMQQKHQQTEISAIPIQRQENKTGMPDNLKSGIENLSGMSMDHVKVHYNSSQPAQLNALAYAQGSDIHIGPGQEKHLPHEAWHVVQQAQGRVQPTRQMKSSVPVNDDPGLEHEADVMGDKALSTGAVQLSSEVCQNKNFPFVAQLVMSDVELADWVDMDEEEWKILEPAEIIRLGILKRMKAALASVKKPGNFATWTYGGIEYHVNVRAVTFHVTSETNPKMHYFFSDLASMSDKRCTKAEQGSHPETKKLFSELPAEVQEFVKKYSARLL